MIRADNETVNIHTRSSLLLKLLTNPVIYTNARRRTDISRLITAMVKLYPHIQLIHTAEALFARFEADVKATRFYLASENLRQLKLLVAYLIENPA